jgi:hypothetical protein
VAKYLVEKGANLFMENNNGQRPIDHPWGPHVLQHAKDLRYASVKDILILSKLCSSSSNIHIPQAIFSVFANSDLTRHIATFFLRTEIIVRDPSIDDEDQEPDDVKIRVEHP